MVKKVREVVKKLREDGWYYVGTEGDHHHYKHPIKSGKVTVPGEPGDDVKIGTLIALERAAGIRLR